MTYDQIVMLDTIVKYGSFKAAAQVLHKSQPSLSVAIKKLEEEFQIQLFDRSEYRPRLTNQGKTFYAKAIEALQYFKDLETTARELGAGFESEITLCAEAIFPIHKIASLLKQFFEPHISTTLNLNIDVIEGVIAKLKSYEVDFALAPDFNQDPEMERIQILSTKVIPVISPDLNEKIRSTLIGLKKIPQIVVGSSVPERKDKVHGAIGSQFWYTSDLFMKEQLISSGLGWGRLPEHQVQKKIEQGELLQIKGIKQISPLIVPLYLIKMKDKILGPNAKNLWDYLSQIKVD